MFFFDSDTIENPEVVNFVGLMFGNAELVYFLKHQLVQCGTKVYNFTFSLINSADSGNH
jgi:hypothetical protein